MFRQGSTCLVLLWILLAAVRFRVRGFHSLRPAFPKPFSYLPAHLLQSEPHVARNMVWPLPISLAATLGITCCFLFLRLLRCFSSPGSLCTVMDWLYSDRGLLCRVSPFGYLRINGHLHLPAAFRSLLRPSSALSAKASTLRSYWLTSFASPPTEICGSAFRDVASSPPAFGHFHDLVFTLNTFSYDKYSIRNITSDVFSICLDILYVVFKVQSMLAHRNLFI